METLTINENKSDMPENIYTTIMDHLQSKEQEKRLIGQEKLKVQCSNRDPLFEPYLLQIMNSICSEDGYISNKNRNVREFFFDTMIDILDHINSNAITLILQDIYKILNHRRWEPQYYGLKCILHLSTNRVNSITRNLQEVIPHVSDLMVSSKQDISELSDLYEMLVDEAPGAHSNAMNTVWRRADRRLRVT